MAAIVCYLSCRDSYTITSRKSFAPTGFATESTESTESVGAAMAAILNVLICSRFFLMTYRDPGRSYERVRRKECGVKCGCETFSRCVLL